MDCNLVSYGGGPINISPHVHLDFPCQALPSSTTRFIDSLHARHEMLNPWPRSVRSPIHGEKLKTSQRVPPRRGDWPTFVSFGFGAGAKRMDQQAELLEKRIGEFVLVLLNCDRPEVHENLRHPKVRVSSIIPKLLQTTSSP